MCVSRQGERFQIQWQESGRQKWVKRFNLLFEDESIDDFKARIHAALRRRQEVERDGRYVSFVDQQPWQHSDTLDERFQQRIIRLAGPQLAAKLPQLTQSFIAEVRSLPMSIRLCFASAYIQNVYGMQLLQPCAHSLLCTVIDIMLAYHDDASCVFT